MATRDALKSSIQDLLISLEIWTPSLSPELPHKWENHGNCIIFNSNTFLSQQWSDPRLTDKLYPLICSLMKITKIARRTGSIVHNCAFRRPQVEILYNLNGDSDGWVFKTENGIKYTWDITKCMFSSGNISEKQRISSFDLRGQTVVDLYAGIGYFTLSYLVHAKANLVYACEWNPDAIEALRKNLILNKIGEDRCIVLPGDNLVNCPKNVADHVNLGLIPSSENSWGVACAALKKTVGGILHVHGNVDLKLKDKTEINSKNIEDCETKLPAGWLTWSQETCSKINTILNGLYCDEKLEWVASVVKIVKIKSYGPCVDHLVVDIKCIPIVLENNDLKSSVPF